MFIVFVFLSTHYFPSAVLLVLLPNLKKIPKRKSGCMGVLQELLSVLEASSCYNITTLRNLLWRNVGPKPFAEPSQNNMFCFGFFFIHFVKSCWATC
jgi:hypothetical protein